ncbi:hypothetical protein AAHA92_26160 [Salvia divinorum]|uniref:Uncharacterized protein n=1 Tax=Salvia divinorum TaxID=28513 RepID=A0ABD1GFM0_SALDI
MLCNKKKQSSDQEGMYRSKGFDSNQNLLADYDGESLVYEGESKKKPAPGEKAVHLIPLVLIFCGLVLWWFSHPVKLH